MTFKPTDEQTQAVEKVMTGEACAIEALAGTGKTTTLRMVGEALPNSIMCYVAFNRSIVNEASMSMPRNVGCRTAHSLAFRQVGGRFKSRLDSRAKPWEVSRMLGITRPFVVTDPSGTVIHRVSINRLAGLVMKSVNRFCQSADQAIGGQHVPRVRALDEPGHWEHNNELQDFIYPYLKRAWDDIQLEQGRLPFSHDCYLKIWELSDPHIPTDLILLDEAQDTNPVTASIVTKQKHAQLVFVGDRHQAIYEWRGAINAMDDIPSQDRSWLTQSFRFGPEVAEVANLCLAELKGERLLTGAGPSGRVVRGMMDEFPNAILCRTNAGVVSSALHAMQKGLKPSIVGGIWDVVSFAESAKALKAGGEPKHPDLEGFTSWSQVVEYANDEFLGSDIALLVRLVEEFGEDEIVNSLKQLPRDERNGDFIISTAHRAKGRQWGHVRIHSDFNALGSCRTDAERRLLYVAYTRAQETLQIVPSEVTMAQPGFAE